MKFIKGSIRFISYNNIILGFFEFIRIKLIKYYEIDKHLFNIK